MAHVENRPNYSFLLDFMATVEVLSLEYIFLRAVKVFYGLFVPDPTVFPSVQYLEII